MELQDFVRKWDEEKSALFEFALALTGDVDDAKDLFQETAEKAVLNYRRFKTENRFSRWIYTLMRNSFINGYNRCREASAMVRLYEFPAMLAEDRTVEANPETAYGFYEFHKLLNVLHAPSRAVFSLYMEGYKYEEIAEMLQIPLGTVKHRIFKARQQIRIWMNEVNIEKQEDTEAKQAPFRPYGKNDCPVISGPGPGGSGNKEKEQD